MLQRKPHLRTGRGTVIKNYADHNAQKYCEHSSKEKHSFSPKTAKKQFCEQEKERKRRKNKKGKKKERTLVKRNHTIHMSISMLCVDEMSQEQHLKL